VTIAALEEKSTLYLTVDEVSGDTQKLMYENVLNGKVAPPE